MKPVASWLLASLLAGCAGAKVAPPTPAESYAPSPESILTPDVVRSRVGTLRFFDGLPDEETVEALYDHLDFLRGVRAYLRMIPAAAIASVREALYDAGSLPNYTVLLTESSMTARERFLTASSEAVYAMAWVDLRGGPIILETPPYVAGVLYDAWGRRLADTGKAGPDGGRGGKYVVVPPAYQGFVPRSEFVVRSRTLGVWAAFRGPLVGGRPEPAVGSFKKYLKIYPLQEARKPAPNPFVDISGAAVDSISPGGTRYFELIDNLVQEEPSESQDAEVLGLLASIGIVKDQRFSPDARMSAILADAATVGDATARALVFFPRDEDALVYPNRQWQRILIGADPDSIIDGALSLEALVRSHYLAAIDTMAQSATEAGSDTESVIVFRDSEGRLLDGGRSYSLLLPPEAPAKTFWSIVVYDNQTRSMLENGRRAPSLSTARGGLRANPDGSITVHFGPERPRSADARANWIRTVPGKGWSAVLRLHGAQSAWFDKSWRPGDIELSTSVASIEKRRTRGTAFDEARGSTLAPEVSSTRIGMLELIDGVPTEQTAKRLYDHLDFMQGVDAFLHGLPGASQIAMRRGLRAVGVEKNDTVAVFDERMDSHSLFLMGNPDVVYAGSWLDLHEGAMVVESPDKVPGVADDFFSRRVAVLGKTETGEDAGGPLLFVPPGYQGQLSEQYSIFKSPTYGNSLGWRRIPVHGDPRPTVEALKRAIRIYPFDVPLLEDLGFDEQGDIQTPAAEEAMPIEQEEQTRFVSVSGRSFSTIAPSDFRLYEDIDALVQEEPAEALGPEILGLFASVGIERGRPFSPEPGMRAILVEAAAVANATARALAFRPRSAEVYLHGDSAWYRLLLGERQSFSRRGASLLDARATFAYLATSTLSDTAANTREIGYAIAATDTNGNYLEGARSYTLTLPKDIPAEGSWSIVVYSPQTRSMLQTPRTASPSLGSARGEVASNEDGSTTVHFGADAPAGHEQSWIQTIPGKGWFAVLWLYGPTQAWLEKTWRPGEIEPVDSP